MSNQLSDLLAQYMGEHSIYDHFEVADHRDLLSVKFDFIDRAFEGVDDDALTVRGFTHYALAMVDEMNGAAERPRSALVSDTSVKFIEAFHQAVNDYMALAAVRSRGHSDFKELERTYREGVERIEKRVKQRLQDKLNTGKFN